MGYNTKFFGSLRFTEKPTAEQLSVINGMHGVDRRKCHPPAVGEWYYFDLVLAGDLSGVRWSGDEKTYDMCGQVNYLLSVMRLQWPTFGLEGEMEALGDDPEDSWILRIENGAAVKIKRTANAATATCPKCKSTFYV